LWAGLSHPLTRDFLVPVILPMGLFNVLGSLENLESAAAAGDTYPTRACMTTNGIGTLAASAFGSCFPTTIYIGHPGWKALGARAAYSSINGIFFAIVTIFGVAHVINAFIPVEAGMAIVLWIGIVITAQAFSATPSRHAPAVALGLFPAIAAWGTLVLTQTLNAAGISLRMPSLATDVLRDSGAFFSAGLHLQGMTALSQGFMLTSLLWSGACACLIDRQFVRAAVFMLIAALLAFFGFIHAGSLTPAGGHYALAPGAGSTWATGYVTCALFLFAAAFWAKYSGQETRLSDPDLSRHG
jgi:adenine/guanine/hypoxanthine permease